VGSIGLYRLGAMTKDPGIGYWLDKDNEGLGIVTRSAAVMVELGFTQFGANLVHITAATENRRSRAVAERLGMTLDGVLRQRTVNAAGEFLDAAYYSVTRDEWQSRGSGR
jgi:ribosomal-protein-serine acetyltransferase